MTEKKELSTITLGEYLAAIRSDRGLTLRQVEEATEKEVSNAYLSQIENGKIKKPAPNILFALGTVYGVDFNKLMMLAGHISVQSNEGARHGRAATFADMDLSDEEEGQLLRYLKFLRSEKE